MPRYAAATAVLVLLLAVPARAQTPDSFTVQLSVGRRQENGRHLWVFQRFVRPGGLVIRRDSMSSACLYDRIPTADNEVPALDSAEVVRRIPSLLRWRRWDDLGVDDEPSDPMLVVALAQLLGPDATISGSDVDALRAELGQENPPVLEIRCIVLTRFFVWSLSRDALLMWPTLPVGSGR